jgi:hypothetical protein
MVTWLLAYGALINKELINWLLVYDYIRISPPSNTYLVVILNGIQFSYSKNFISNTSVSCEAIKADIRSYMGLYFILSQPLIMAELSGFISKSKVVKNLAVVPELQV